MTDVPNTPLPPPPPPKRSGRVNQTEVLFAIGITLIILLLAVRGGWFGF